MEYFRSVLYRLSCDAAHREFLICGADNKSMQLCSRLKLIDLPVKAFLVKDSDKEMYPESLQNIPIISYEELRNENLDKIRIIILDDRQAKELEACGLEKEKHFRSLYYNDSLRQEYRLDANMGYNLVVDNAMPGFKSFGNVRNKERIVILGNSTSDPCLFPFKCWAEILSEKMTEKNILCGAVSGHMSPQELLKLIRDVIPLRPEKVISYSGFQDMNNTFRDLEYPFIHRYQKEMLRASNIDRWIDIYYTKDYSYGVKSGYSPYMLWKNSMRMMHAVCEEFGIEFIAVLQPSIFTKMKCLGKKDWEIVLHYELRDEYVEHFANFFDEYAQDSWRPEWLYDFTEIFHDWDGVYLDNCHVNETGNKIIAEKIWEIVR